MPNMAAVLAGYNKKVLKKTNTVKPNTPTTPTTIYLMNKQLHTKPNHHPLKPYTHLVDATARIKMIAQTLEFAIPNLLYTRLR